MPGLGRLWGRGRTHLTPELNQLSLLAVKILAIRCRSAAGAMLRRPISAARRCCLSLVCLAQNPRGQGEKKKSKKPWKRSQFAPASVNFCEMNFQGLAALASSHPHLPVVTLAPSKSSPQRFSCRIPEVIRAFVSNEKEHPCLEPKASPWSWLQRVNVDDLCCKSLWSDAWSIPNFRQVLDMLHYRSQNPKQAVGPSTEP